MAHDREEISEMDQLFNALLNELEKQPISKAKAIEMERQFLTVIERNYAKHPHHTNFTEGDQVSTEIILDMNKLAKRKEPFRIAHIPERAYTWASGLVYSAVGILFITIGFIIITTPIAPEFEIATIFYFNEYDGFTVLDLFALLIIFIGVYFFIRAFISKEKH
jgi:hypothetical protein